MRHLMNAFVLLVLLLTIASAADAQAPPYEFEGHYSVLDHKVELRWHRPNSMTNPTSYNVYRRLSTDVGFSLIASPVDHQYNDFSVTLGLTYFYYITAVYPGSVESVPTPTVMVVISNGGGGGDSILAPRELVGHFDDSGKNELDWMRPSMMSHPLFYKVYRNTTTDTAYSVVGTPFESEFDDHSIALNTTYNYFVTAMYFGNIESGPSNVVQVQTIPDSSEDSGFVQVHFSTTPPHVAFLNQLFQYDADVVTVPPDVPVKFSLRHAPAGMTIDSATGLVSWTPTSMGAFEVEIKARTIGSSEGEAEQEFHLLVMNGNPGQVQGTVRNTNGDGLANVKIRLFDVAHGHFVMRVYTDNTGHYAFPFVNPATYFVRAKTEDSPYKSQWYDGVSEMANATPVVVAENATVVVDFTLQLRDTTVQHFTLSGTVMDSGSTPIAGARVTVFKTEDDSSHGGFDDDHHHGHDHEQVMSTLTDANGNYSFNLRSNFYVVRAGAEGYFSQYWDHKENPFEADRINLQSNTSGINFNLMPRVLPNGSISGTIRSAADSTSLRSLVLGFRATDSTSEHHHFVASAYSDSTGQYTLEHVPDGDFYVLAVPRHHNENEFEPTFYNTSGGTPFFDSASAVTVAGGPVTGIDIYAQPDSDDGLNTVAGQVSSGSSGSGAAVSAIVPEAGVIVSIVDVQMNQTVGSAITMPDGSYLTTGLAPGSYDVVFQKPGKQTASVPVTVAYSNNTPTTITVDAQISNAGGTGQIGSMSIRRYWNIVSVPVDVADAHRNVLFPSSSSEAFSFSGAGGYQMSPVLGYGSGYWLKFPAATFLTLAGTERTTQTITLHEGWNLIGALSKPVAVSSIATNPPSIISSNAFGYGGGYSIATTIQPGKGYWMKASQAGTLTMNTAVAAPKTISRVSPYSKLNSITIQDAMGNSQVLYFGADDKSIDVNQLDMPPLPPNDAFDARFGSQRFAELHGPSTHAQEFPITLQSSQGALTISWSIKSAGVNYTLTDATGKTKARLTGQGSVQMNSANATRLTLKVQPQELPKAFALRQNYPNPFNPTTKIDFELPVASMTTLKIYNLLGQEVATLLDNSQLDGGVQTIQFDASNLPSGVYFYRLIADGGSQAGSFTSVRKMMLVK